MADRRLRAAFYVQHLLGIGHLVRAFRVAAALAAEDWEVELLVGGVLPPGLAAGQAHIVPLPPVMAGSSGLSSLVHPDGTPFDATAQAARRDILLGHVAAFRPDVLLIEAFPFGRRQMRFELLPLLEACRTAAEPPLVATSVRDILQATRHPERARETVALVDRFFDLVLAHGDPTLARLEDTFPEAAAFRDKIAYTGLVAPDPPASKPEGSERFDVVVSAGGGAVGGALLRAAVAARPLTSFARRRWLVLTGPNLPEASRRAIAEASGGKVVVRTFSPELVRLLGAASVSVSQAGYNTVADLLITRCPAVLVPFATGGETEQTVRATLLAAQGRASVVTETELGPDRLAAAIEAAVALPRQTMPYRLDGARRSAEILSEALVQRRP